MRVKNRDGSPSPVRSLNPSRLNTSLVLAAALALAAVAVPAGAQEDGFDSGDIAPGASWSHTFTEVFEEGHEYHCHPHPWMEGMVHVQPDSDGETAVVRVDIVEGADSDDWGYSVEHLVIEAGDTVIWTNTGDAVHTVTQVQGDGHGEHGDDPEGDHPHDPAAADGNDAPGPAWVGVLLGIATVLTFSVLRRR